MDRRIAEFRGSFLRLWRGTLAVLAVGLAGLGLSAAPASASFHLMRIREVYPAGSASYVELQMLSTAENLVGGHHLVLYNTNGTVADDFTLPNNVNPGPNNTTILIAGSGYTAAFPSGPSPDELDTSMNLSASGGAVCWVEGSPPDCVAWGNFTGPFPAHTPALVAGNPASPSGVTAGRALRRTIAPNCPTLLEEADDTDDSATDFSEQTPNPRNNASPVTETACSLATTTIDSKPSNPTKATSAEFTYHSSPVGAEFECKLDAAEYASCLDEGVEYPGPLTEGSHTFRVRAKNSVGTGSPAVYTWTVDLTPPTASINSHPANPSPGGSVSFTYSSNEVNSTFECSLVEEGLADSFASCPATGTTYTSLENGLYAFKVRATDKAGNQSSAAAYMWQVDNSLTDTTPPETTIDSKPTDPSGSSTAAFTYSSNEPGSTFQCALDGAAFASCPSTGVTYSGLAEGAHTFQVRAIDSSNNVDPTPAGYSFSVVLAPPVITPAPTPTPTVNWKKRCRRIKNHKARKRCLRKHHVR
jgi:hypothetical protein